MSVILETEVSRSTSSTWRVVQDPDPKRGEWTDFTGMSLSDQWLRHGKNPNIRTGTPEARRPFVVNQDSSDIEAYDRGVDFLFSPGLLNETSTNCINLSRMLDSDNGNTVLVGNVTSGRRTIPAVIIGSEVDGRRELVHTFIPKAPTL